MRNSRSEQTILSFSGFAQNPRPIMQELTYTGPTGFRAQSSSSCVRCPLVVSNGQ